MVSKTDRTICGTCQYWTGERDPIFDKNGVAKVTITDKTGFCQKEGCRFDGQTRRQDNCCIRYSKWTELL